MNTKAILKSTLAGALAFAALGLSATGALAADGDRDSVRVSVSYSSDDDHRRDDRRYDHRRSRDGRVVNREVYDTRYRARIVLIEEIVRTRRGPQLVCTVDARGPQAHRIPRKHLRKIARRECSRRADIRIVA